MIIKEDNNNKKNKKIITNKKINNCQYYKNILCVLKGFNDLI